ncbi:hypothetical protein E2553_06030 [Paraburkholderia dipogonis]|uniref:Uncharacterized protein n=1 Tax=Paraburkholderia dipogonis TaxID=1211383 RepID=A0A4Y8N479_9BURK|nr:hypothetical protein E2553_06030 [Paraburkholderia dipogonis]
MAFHVVGAFRHDLAETYSHTEAGKRPQVARDYWKTMVTHVPELSEDGCASFASTQTPISAPIFRGQVASAASRSTQRMTLACRL